MDTILITQARYGSSRLPGKILLTAGSKELLRIHLERLSKCKKIDKILVATTTNLQDDKVFDSVTNWGYEVVRGSEDDVLDRYYRAAEPYSPDWVVRVTSDCPLIDPLLVDEMVDFAHRENKDYVSNVLVENYPDGQDIEVFKFSALQKAWKDACLKSEREHVTPYIRNNSDVKGGGLFSAANYACHDNYSHIRMTVDETHDLDLIRRLVDGLGTEETWLKYTQYIIDNGLESINGSIKRNEGLLKSLQND